MNKAALRLKTNPEKTHFVDVVTSYSKGGVITYIVRHEGETESKTYVKDEIEYFKYQMS